MCDVDGSRSDFGAVEFETDCITSKDDLFVSGKYGHKCAFGNCAFFEHCKRAQLCSVVCRSKQLVTLFVLFYETKCMTNKKLGHN